MNKENCALKLVDEIILYYDARSKKHQKTKLCLTELITKLLELERTLYRCTGRRLKCHTGRYGSLGRIVARSCCSVYGRIVARSCACGHCTKRITVLKQGKCSESRQAGFEETLGFRPSWASDVKKNWKIKRDSGVIDKKKNSVLFVIDIHCEKRKVNSQC